MTNFILGVTNGGQIGDKVMTSKNYDDKTQDKTPKNPLSLEQQLIWSK